MAEQTDILAFPPHFDGKRFFNPGARQARGLSDVLRWKLTARPRPSPRSVGDVKPSQPPPRVDSSAARITMVNHSTVLLQQGGLNILTDPVWSERASPLSWAGPKRRRIPGIEPKHLPRADIVLISHNHYDHCDLETLRWLATRDAPDFIVPLGLAPLLRSANIEAAREMDWGDTLEVRGVAVTAVPALHFSARGLFDRNRTLWCGYMIGSAAEPVYFAGDTAFGSHFAAIRDRFGPPRLALLPIGAYEPRWFMSSVHMSPEQAVEAHRILGSRLSVAIHHGTFQLADEALDEPRERFLSSNPPESFILLDNGGHAVFGS